MSNKKCSLTVFDGKKTLYGTAAQLKHISDSGGWDTFLEKFTAEIIDNFSKLAVSEYNKRQQRPKLRKIK